MGRVAAGVDRYNPSLPRGDLEEFEAKVGLIHRKDKNGKWKWKIALKIPVMRGGKRRWRGVATVLDAARLTGHLWRVDDEVWSQIPSCCIGGRPGADLVGEVQLVAGALKSSGAAWVLKGDVSSAFASTSADRAFSTLRGMVHANASSLAVIEGFYGRQRKKFGGSIIEGPPPSMMMLVARLAEVLVPVLAAHARYYRIYVDDFIAFFDSHGAAAEALAAIEVALRSENLFLHPDKTRIRAAFDGDWSFLGFNYKDARIFPVFDRRMELLDELLTFSRRKDIGRALAVMEGWVAHFCGPMGPGYDPQPFIDIDATLAAELGAGILPPVAELVMDAVLTGKVTVPGAFGPILQGWKASHQGMKWAPRDY